MMDDETKAIESLTRELDLTRLEMAALTDALNRQNTPSTKPLRKRKA